MEIINLDMTPSTVTPNAHAGQYDASRTVRFMLKNGGVPFTLAGTETITAEITRSDNTEVTVNVANTSSNYVDVVFDDTVCTVKGLYACELRLKDSDGFDIGSKNFALLVQRDPYDGAGVRIVTVGPADICTFETTLADPLQSVTVNIVATGGNGTPDNPNPINGYTEANITRCGVNLVYKTISGTYVDSGGFIGRDYQYDLQCAVVKQGVTYTMSGAFSFIGSFFTSEPEIGSISYDGARIVGGPLTFTAPISGYAVFRTASGYATPQLELGNTASDYHPYNGQTYAIAFGQTVYGGVLDVTRGKLTNSMPNKPSLNDLAWDKSARGMFCTYDLASIVKRPTSQLVKGNIMCEICPTDTADNVYAKNQGIAINTDGAIWLFLNDYENKTVAEMLTDLGAYYLTYELAAPFDIDLTPEVISAVVGENNVFANCGETTVKYLKAGE